MAPEQGDNVIKAELRPNRHFWSLPSLSAVKWTQAKCASASKKRLSSKANASMNQGGHLGYAWPLCFWFFWTGVVGQNAWDSRLLHCHFSGSLSSLASLCSVRFLSGYSEPPGLWSWNMYVCLTVASLSAWHFCHIAFYVLSRLWFKHVKKAVGGAISSFWNARAFGLLGRVSSLFLTHSPGASLDLDGLGRIGNARHSTSFYKLLLLGSFGQVFDRLQNRQGPGSKSEPHDATGMNKTSSPWACFVIPQPFSAYII